MSVDFDRVPDTHEAMHKRLQNWAQWVRPRDSSAKNVHPMWRQFVASRVWDDRTVRSSLDTLDALAIEKAVSALPEKQRFAVRWRYVYSGHPGRAARFVGVTQQGLADLILDGTQMLINVKA